MARPGTFLGEVERGWGRFRGLRWHKKALFAAAAIVCFALAIPAAVVPLLMLAVLIAFISLIAWAAEPNALPAPPTWDSETDAALPPPPPPGARPVIAGPPPPSPARQFAAATSSEAFARYCGYCGEAFSASDWLCPECGRLWSHDVPGVPIAALAWMLSELTRARKQGRLDATSYRRLREDYEARLIAARPARARPEPVAAEPTPEPAPAPLRHPTPVFTSSAPAARPHSARPAPEASPRPVAPPPSRPAAPPKPPVDVNKLVRDWAAKRQADLLLYLGAFLLTISAIIFVNYQGGIVGGTMKVAVLAGYTVGFLALGMGLRRWDRVKEASPVFVAIGALLTPLNFVMIWVQLGGGAMSLASVWLTGSATTAALYLFLAWRGYGRFYVGPAVVAALVAWGSLAATIHIPTEWYGAWFASTATLTIGLGTLRYQLHRRLFEVAGAVLGGPAIAWAIACAALSGEHDFVRSQLPITLAIIIPALIAEVVRFRSRPSYALLPAIVAAAIGSVAWAAHIPRLEEGDWATMWPLLAAGGYLVVASLERKHAATWAAVAAFAGGATLLAAHAVAAAGGDPVALPVTYGFAFGLGTAAWLKWRWAFAAAVLPPLLSLTAATTLWSADLFAFEWCGAAIASTGIGYLALVWLHRPQSSAWRQLALVAAASAVATAHIGAATPDTNGIQLAIVYGVVLAGAVFDGAVARFTPAWLFAPAAAVGTAVSALWVAGVPEAQWAWPALAVAALVGATEFAWRRSSLLERAGWPYAIVLALAPVLAVRLFLDEPATGAGAFAAAAVVWLAAALRARGTVVGVVHRSLSVGAISVERTALSYGSAAFAFTALGFTNRALGWELPLAAWTYLGTGVAAWLAVAALGRRVPELHRILGPIGAAALLIAVAGALGDWGQETMMGGLAAAAAAVTIQRPFAAQWRLAMVVAAGETLLFAHGHAVAEGRDAWQLPAAYGFVFTSFLWDTLVNRNDRSWLAIPASLGVGTSAAAWLFGAPPEHWAWPGPGLALAIELTSRWWTRKPALAAFGWPYALLGGLVPIAFITPYVDIPWIGAAAFAAGTATWLGATIFSRGAIVGPSAANAERKVVVERRFLAWGTCGLALGSIAFVDEALGWSLPESAWSFAAAGMAAWLTTAAAGRRVPELNGIFGPVGAAALALATILAAGYPGQQAITLGGAAVAAALATQPGYAPGWRAMMLVAAGIGLTFAHTAGLTDGPGTWELPATYGLVIAACTWDAAGNRFDPSWLAVPALVSAGAASSLFVLDVGAEQWAWPALGAALAVEGTERWWRQRDSLYQVGWPYALTLGLAPALFVSYFRDAPAIGSGAFAGAALVWAVAAAFARDGIIPMPGPDRRPMGERAVLGLAAAGLLLASDGYFAWAMGWSQAQAAWSFVGAATLAWAATGAIRSRIAELNVVLIVTALSATATAVLAAHGHPGESSALVAVSAAGSLAACYGVGRWPTAYMPAIGSAVAMGFLWRYTGWTTSTLALAYAAGAAGASLAFTPLRTWSAGERSATAGTLSTTPWALALGTVAVSLNNRYRVLATDESLVTTAEWAALTVIVLAAGCMLFAEGLRLKVRAVALSATAILLLGTEFAIAMLEPTSAQAYMTPLGCYVIALALYVRTSGELFGAHMRQHEGLMFLGEAIVVLPGARDALASSDLRWSLLLITEGMVLLGIGFVLAQRWLVVGGVLTLVGVAGRFFTSGDYQPPYWLTLAIVGMVLLAGGVVLLGAREWWDRTRDRVVHWWFGGGPPRGEGGMHGPLPPVSHA